MLMANPSSTTPTPPQKKKKEEKANPHFLFFTPSISVIKVNLIVLNENFLLRLCGVPSA